MSSKKDDKEAEGNISRRSLITGASLTASSVLVGAQLTALRDYASKMNDRKEVSKLSPSAYARVHCQDHQCGPFTAEPCGGGGDPMGFTHCLSDMCVTGSFACSGRHQCDVHQCHGVNMCNSHFCPSNSCQPPGGSINQGETEPPWNQYASLQDAINTHDGIA